eukprot:TRINITY_DN2514_c0_g1_i1.p1 TRINITY_DN2514_c0_g1~~TRINITY_DN2514_c0_g1_i1.p1  ORF type:complete len:379 (+),score=74.31 TRINITY_DN2514_c0_g1_i1:45-1181(+)
MKAHPMQTLKKYFSQKKIEELPSQLFNDAWELLKKGDDVERLKGLLDSNPYLIKMKNSKGDTLLHLSVLYGRLQCTQMILERKKCINKCDSFSETPLIWAIRYAPMQTKLEQVITLINLGCNIDKGDPCPLWVAASLGYSSIVETLVDHGAKINNSHTINGRAFTPRQIAAERGFQEVVEFLEWTECVRDITEEDNPAKIEDILKHDRPLEQRRDNNGNTIIHYAAKYGRQKLLKILLETNRYDVNSRNLEGRTPLYFASSKGYLECMKLLLNHGATVDLGDKHGRTPLWKAACHGHIQATTLLAFEGAKLKSRGMDCNGQDYFPAQIAAKKGHKELAAQLIAGSPKVERKPDVQNLTDSSSSPIMRWKKDDESKTTP